MRVEFDWNEFSEDNLPPKDKLLIIKRTFNNHFEYIIGTYEGLRKYVDTQKHYFDAKEIRIKTTSVTFGKKLIYDVKDHFKTEWDFWCFEE